MTILVGASEKNGANKRWTEGLLFSFVYSLERLVIVWCNLYDQISLGRVLSSMKNTKVQQDCSGSSQSGEVDNVENLNPVKDHAKGGQISHFLPTSRRIVQFSNGKVHQVYSLNSTENYSSIVYLYIASL